MDEAELRARLRERVSPQQVQAAASEQLLMATADKVVELEESMQRLAHALNSHTEQMELLNKNMSYAASIPVRLDDTIKKTVNGITHDTATLLNSHNINTLNEVLNKNKAEFRRHIDSEVKKLSSELKFANKFKDILFSLLVISALSSAGYFLYASKQANDRAYEAEMTTALYESKLKELERNSQQQKRRP